MNDSTLLLPDTGPEFMRTLNLAVLYSESVHVFTFTKPETAIALASNLRAIESVFIQVAEKVSGKEICALLSCNGECEECEEYREDPADSFLKFSEQHASLLALAETEGVVHSISELAVSNIRGNADVTNAFLGLFGDVIRPANGEWRDKVPLIWDAIGECPPSLFFLLERLFSDAIIYGNLLNKLPDKVRDQLDEHEDVVLQVAFAAYILLASYYALSNGLATVTWQARLQEVLALGSDLILKGVPSVNELLLQRRKVANRLGQLILQDEVPNVADLPLEEVLEIRRKRNPEILAFRDGLRQLAADIDASQGAKALELALDTKIQCVFKPALRDLRNAIAELQMEAYKRLIDPAKEVGAALIPVAISLSAGAPLETTAMVGAAFALLAKLHEFIVGTAVEKRKVMNASPWSLLFHLQKRGSG